MSENGNYTNLKFKILRLSIGESFKEKIANINDKA